MATARFSVNKVRGLVEWDQSDGNISDENEGDIPMESWIDSDSEEGIKILGVHFTYNASLFYKLNFESIKKIAKKLAKGMGFWRGLTLIGKVLCQRFYIG